MIYLTGATSDRDEPKLLEYGVGLMLNPGGGYNADRVSRYGSWAADNGCFSQGDRFNQSKWLAWLERFQAHTDTCLFVVAPDVVGDAGATWERCRDVLPVIRAMGFPVAFVAQNGIRDTVIPWDAFDCLFVGGDNAFKLAEDTYALVREAKERGKWTHMGRVNSLRRLQAAQVGGYDSADGTFLAFGPDVNLPRVRRWMQVLAQQPRLDGIA